MKAYTGKVLGVSAACLVVAFIFCLTLHISLKLHVVFAMDQIKVFESAMNASRTASVGEVAEYLRVTRDYYPSGTKQKQGSQLDWLVEEIRRMAMGAIINELRHKTSSDLGNEPGVWIDKYGDKKT